MKSHRALSSVIGAVFLIAILVGALSYISYSFELMGNFSEVLITEDSRLKEKQNEAFEITSVDFTAANKLDVVIKNTGQIPVKITTLYIDEIGVNDVVNKTTIDETIFPGSSFDFISENIDIDIDSTKGYNLKLITSRGETQTFYLNSASQESLDIRLIALPEIIPTGFSTTLMMVVVNNMSNNNPLINLTPIEPACSGICTKLFGPTPATYDTLNPGDAAIFEWSYALDGDDDDSITFTSGIENGFPGNTDSETVTIKTVELSEVAGESIVAAGFGTRSSVDNTFIFHDEIFGIPAGDNNYQLSSLVPDSSGIPLTFNGASPSFEFFSANVTLTDAHFPAGNWNASLRYYNDHLPSGMDSLADNIWASGFTGGMKLHFEDISPTSGIYDSTEDATCYALATHADSESVGVTHSTTLGVNGSGAYYFPGDDSYLQYKGQASKGACNVPHNSDAFSMSAWFKSTADISNVAKQRIITYDDDTDVGDMGGYTIYLSEGSDSALRGTVYFEVKDQAGGLTNCESYADSPSSAPDYADGEWHHVAVRFNGSGCVMWIDGVWIDGDDEAADNHYDGSDNDVWIGAYDGGTTEEFTGYIDDVMFWRDYGFIDPDDVEAIFEHSFGYNSTNLNFVISNYTDAGVLSNTIVTSNDYGMKWSDQGHYSSDNDIFTGGNYTVSLPEVRLNLLPDHNRLGFTMSFASGEPLYLNIDDSALDGSGSNLLSSYLQPPTLVSPQILPEFYTYTWDQDLPLLKFFAYNAGDVGVWFTYQGTRIVLNGTNGNYSGLVDKIDGATMTINSDSPFVVQYSDVDIDFFPPQAVPINDIPPTDNEKVIPGTYNVTVFLNGYDEYGTIFVRSIHLPTITVIE